MLGEVWELAGLLAHRRWDRARLEALRRKKLQRLIAHAYCNVPYYRRLMDQAGVKPEQIQSEADLVRMPVSTKDDLRRAGDACRACGARDLMVLYTSGYSGKPFEVKLTRAEYRRRRLREFRMLLGMGVRPRDRLVLLGPVRPRPRRLHRLLGFYRLTVIPLTLPPEEQLARLLAARPDVLWVYPHNLKLMLSHAGPGLFERVRPRLLISSSSMLDSVTRERMERYLPGVPILEAYAANESGRIAAACRFDRGLHLEQDAVIVELLDGNRPAAPGCPGRVVLTCLDQFAMPFIRYELGDVARLRGGNCPCGWGAPLIDPPLGRASEMFRSRDGRQISPAALDLAAREWPSLWQYRFIQHDYDLVEAQLVFETRPSPEALDRLRHVMEAKIGGGIRFELRLLDKIEDEGIKAHSFVCRLPAEDRPEPRAENESAG